MTTTPTHRYAVRRTLDVRPENYGTLQGTDYGAYPFLADAIRSAQGRTRLGYPSRVVDTVLGRAVWVRP